ncbi:hypothetical protein ACIAOF_18930, partial [Salmonella enterica subsp. enterica serovar Altona]
MFIRHINLTISEGRYREISGLYWEDFHPGDVF